MWEPGQPTPKPIQLPCGARATFDRYSGISYRCLDCFSVVGSMGMPRDCADLFEQYGAVEVERPAMRIDWAD